MAPSSAPRLYRLEQSRCALPAADAHRDDAIFLVAALQFAQHEAVCRDPVMPNGWPMLMLPPLTL